MTPELEKAIREARAELGEGHTACRTGGIDNAVTAALCTLADPSDERVEAVARGIWQEYGTPPYAWETLNPHARERWRRVARASIASDVKFLLGEG